MPGEELLTFGFKLVREVGAVLSHRTKRLYIYGAGRVGKTTFSDIIHNPKLRFKETEDNNPTPGKESNLYTFAPELNMKWRDYTIELHGFGGQGGKKAKRWEHFDTVKPVGVIFIVSPYITLDDYDDFKPEDEMFSDNETALIELVELLSRPREHDIDFRCGYVLPAISYKDVWGPSGIDYESVFQKRFQPYLDQLGSYGIRVANKWYGYSAKERADMLYIVEDCLEHTGYTTNIDTALGSAAKVLDAGLKYVDTIAGQAERTTRGLNPVPDDGGIVIGVKPPQQRRIITSIVSHIFSIIGSIFRLIFSLIIFVFRQLRSLLLKLRGT
jgi:hypothetical protein